MREVGGCRGAKNVVQALMVRGARGATYLLGMGGFGCIG